MENIKEELIIKNDSKSPISEIFRTLRTNLQFINHKENIKTILITSTIPQEGKSFISANLAVTFAKANKKVLLIDADMRRGRQYSVFNILPKKGLSNYLLDFSKRNEEMKNGDYIQKTEIEGLEVITAGSTPPNPSELLASETMISWIEELKENYDIIVLDGPPVQLVTDSIILTRIAHRTVIVASCNETKKDNLHKIIASIKDVGGKIAGIVVNKAQISAKTYKNSYYDRDGENKK